MLNSSVFKFSQRRRRYCCSFPYWDLPKVFLILVLIHHEFGFISACPSPPPSPLNSRLVDGKIVCDDGFDLFGEPVPECKKTGDYTLPVCAKAISRYSSLEKTCTATVRESNPSFKLDLLHSVPVNFVRLLFGSGTSNIDVEIRAGNNSAAAGKNPICKWETGPMNDTVQCRPITAQFVYVQLVGEGLLQLCDIQVFSTHDPSRCKPSTVAGEVVSVNSTCYEIVSTGHTYPSASAQCTSRKGHLLSANYPLTVLKDKLDQLKGLRQLYWIGVERDRGFTSRTWRWTQSGEVVKKPPWGKDQPNNYNREQNCVMLDGQRDWSWNDVGCNVDMIGFICEFKAVTCPTPDRRELTSFQLQPEYRVGYRVRYECPVGHYVIGPEYRECLGNSRWTEVAPVCKYVDCGSYFTELEHGGVTKPNRTDFGAVIKYTCDSQYTLVGVGERSCKEDGGWSGTHPQCLISSCSPPPPLINGTVATSGLSPNSMANYSCNSGSILIGTSGSVCILGGKWEPAPPSCQYIECPTVPKIGHGRIVPEDLMLNSMAQVVCDEGFWVDGDDTLVCGADSKWTGHGGCIPITCNEPAVPAGGYITGYDFGLYSEINYHCDEGYVLVGQSLRKCQNTGEWSGTSPICRYVDCGRAPTVPHGQLNYQSTHVGSTIRYSCANNYKLNGDQVRACEEDGLWSGVTPKCEEIRCSEPILPPNAVISVTLNDRSAVRSLITVSAGGDSTRQTFRLGSVIRYRCERGYKMVGDTNAHTCIDGDWNGVPPSCHFVDCGSPPSILHGKYDLSSNTTFLSSSATYECHEGWRLEGKAHVICGENGDWSGRATCDEITCERLDSDKILITSYKPKGVAMYSCPRGTELLGNATRVCSESGEWSGVVPKCSAIPCPPPPSVVNSRMFPPNPSMTHSTQVEYHCAPGFVRQGSAVLTCYDGKWNPSDPPICAVQEKQSTLPVVVGSSIGILVVILLILGLTYLYFQNRRAKPEPVMTRGGPVVHKDTPMVLFEPHYYDNPTPEHIYEDVNERNSIVTINGVAVS